MKQLIVLLILFPSAFVQAQQFTLITTGEIATSARDSRSCNFLDFNGDLLDDLFISNGPSSGQANQLFLSNGDGTFQPVAAGSLVENLGKSVGATFGDVDNDGDLDAFVTTWYNQPNFFYRNNGDNTFTLEPNTANNGGTFSEAASWGDYNQDGWLDLVVANSTDFATNTPAIKRNLFYRNIGDGDFESVTAIEPVTDINISRVAQWIDYDNDHDLDLWVANEENEPNFLYRNNGGSFEKQTDIGLNALTRSSTGSSWGDIDNDGDLDLFIANYGNQPNQLFRNNGPAGFEPINTPDIDNTANCSFGSNFGDFDNDGDLDLIVTNGFCAGTLTNSLYQNDGNGNFSLDQNSIADLSTQCSFGTAWGDFNKDGFLDLIIANCSGNGAQQPPNSLFQNNGNANHWVRIHLEGQSSNRSAIGSRISMKTIIGGVATRQMRAIEGQSGYCGQNSLIVHFGLGDATIIDSIFIEWPSGLFDVYTNWSVDSTYSITESVASSTPLLPTQSIPFQLFPNPTDGQLTINYTLQTEIDTEVKLEIRDIYGQLVSRYSMPPTNGTMGTFALTLPAIPNGIYWASIKGPLVYSQPIPFNYFGK